MRPSIVVRVDNRVRMEVPEDVASRLRALFEHPNPQHARLRSMGYAARGEPRVYKTWRKEGKEHSFPRGGLQRIREVLREMGIPWTVVDQRQVGQEELDAEYSYSGGEVAPYQFEAVAAMTLKQNAILRAPTGSRKTSMAMMMIARWRVPTLVLVDDTGLAEQWAERAADELRSYDRGHA